MELTSLVVASLFWIYKLDNRLPDHQASQLKISLQMAEENNERLNECLRQKSQEIANMLITIERKNKALESIKKNIQEVIGKVRSMEDKSLLVPLINMNMEINENLNGDSIIERCEEEYNLSNNDFLHRLTARFPLLNNNERMVCVYLRMNRTTKEIATLLNLSIRGVETIRYHLRKKLGLDRKERLSTVLAEF